MHKLTNGYSNKIHWLMMARKEELTKKGGVKLQEKKGFESTSASLEAGGQKE